MAVILKHLDVSILYSVVTLGYGTNLNSEAEIPPVLVKLIFRGNAHRADIGFEEVSVISHCHIHIEQYTADITHYRSERSIERYYVLANILIAKGNRIMCSECVLAETHRNTSVIIEILFAIIVGTETGGHIDSIVRALDNGDFRSNGGKSDIIGQDGLAPIDTSVNSETIRKVVSVECA